MKNHTGFFSQEPDSGNFFEAVTCDFQLSGHQPNKGKGGNSNKVGNIDLDYKGIVVKSKTLK